MFLFQTPGVNGYNLLDHKGSFLLQMKENPVLQVLEDDQLLCLLEDMHIYTYGLTAMICADRDGEYDYDYYENKLHDMGFRLISYQLITTGKFKASLEKMGSFPPTH